MGGGSPRICAGRSSATPLRRQRLGSGDAGVTAARRAPGATLVRGAGTVRRGARRGHAWRRSAACAVGAFGARAARGRAAKATDRVGILAGQNVVVDAD